MRTIFSLLLTTILVVVLPGAYCIAAETVTSRNSAWVLLPNSIGPNSGTFAMPANIPGCGTENEPLCEPVGDFVISSPLTTSGYYTILDPDGSVSDYIVFGNTGPSGTGEIFFFSDPSLGSGTPSGTNLGVLCREVATSLFPVLIPGGCTGSFTLTTTSGTTFTVTAASDDEFNFDPFGFNFDSSDQIMFTGVSTMVQTPPPIVSKSFADSEIQLLGPTNTVLSFTITNPDAAALTGIAFSDTLPSGLIVSTPNALTGSCDGGTVTATAGSNSISLSGATLTGGASCSFSLSVSAIAVGQQVNTTSVISASSGTIVGPPGTATTSVDYLFFYWFFAE